VPSLVGVETLGPDLLSAADDLWRSVQAYGDGDRGTVVLAYGASASYETAPQLVHALAERQPNIDITTLVKSVTEIVAGVGAGSIDIGLVRCPPARAGVDVRPVRRERQGVLMRRDHTLASRPQLGVAELADDRLLMHPREANPGHYDAVLALCREHGVEPEVELRAMSFDLGYGPIQRQEAVAIVGESSRLGLPDELCWVPLHPQVRLEVSFLVRSHNRRPVVDRILDAAGAIAAELQWT
jgi:DNA-binding transcriptional LysR family regulator